MRECDLIMKGGVTSGVVYPHAVVEIARSYRLRSIGGTSAGAIAAVLAAAAEYRRQSTGDFSGFEDAQDPRAGIAGIAMELGAAMKGLFQPAPRLGPHFNFLMAVLAAKGGCKPLAWAKVALATGIGALLTVTLVIGPGVLAAGLLGADPSLLQWGALVTLAGLAIVGLALWWTLRLLLPAHDFGLCAGLTRPGATGPALTDWLADHIDRIAGKLEGDGQPGKPLTIGDLAQRGITLAAMTTDLSSRRPYQLPLQSDHHFFSEAEFRRLFPKRVVDHLIGGRKPLTGLAPGLPDDLFPLASGQDFPVLLVARLSLSFPGLISAVPLYRNDYQLPEDHAQGRMQRCLFSDGGISSNFPIHFFDALLPSRPTFGITLVSWDKARHGDTRVAIPGHRRQSTDLAVRPIPGLGAFLGAIMGAAKDWQDQLQSLMPGYADRIVEIRLDDSSEGGMNLAMSETLIKRLIGFGRTAGQMLVTQFDFDEHRWLRGITALPRLAQTLNEMDSAYAAPPPAGAQSYARILTTRVPNSYAGLSPTWRRKVLEPFAADLSGIGRVTGAETGPKSVRRKGIPKVDSQLRIVASADRAPRSS